MAFGSALSPIASITPWALGRKFSGVEKYCPRAQAINGSAPMSAGRRNDHFTVEAGASFMRKTLSAATWFAPNQMNTPIRKIVR